MLQVIKQQIIRILGIVFKVIRGWRLIYMMMNKFTLLVGNDINNISPGISWSDLLTNIKEKYKVSSLENGLKPFPMLYEEIFLGAIKKQHINERELKSYISDCVSKIKQNEIHQLIREIPIKNIITTNYDFSLEGQNSTPNTGLIRETTYSIFRRHESERKTYWHIHGDCLNPSSINLGYEHYCGQLQKMRDYVVNGTNYSSETVYKDSLMKRLNQKKRTELQSWIDLFFTQDIHIFGLSLDLVEIDLWWLLTYRARNKYYKRSSFIKNQLFYYTSKKWYSLSKDKMQLLQAHDVEIIVIDEADKTKYYKKVLAAVRKRYQL
ncbi:SIR2 family protein [uncultured Sphingobacterium sp.]|uniref:SIR2 family protein n=1 Tax=uncultured Sphingobacterium sp. TaxID=182688 RepID=UPI0025FD1995|nr:SIR2 family protein [uncultured Sphingobacterium sp.]